MTQDLSDAFGRPAASALRGLLPPRPASAAGRSTVGRDPEVPGREDPLPGLEDLQDEDDLDEDEDDDLEDDEIEDDEIEDADAPADAPADAEDADDDDADDDDADDDDADDDEDADDEDADEDDEDDEDADEDDDEADDAEDSADDEDDADADEAEEFTDDDDDEDDDDDDLDEEQGGDARQVGREPAPAPTRPAATRRGAPAARSGRSAPATTTTARSAGASARRSSADSSNRRWGVVRVSTREHVDLLVLLALRGRPGNGFEVISRLEEDSNGALNPPERTVHSTLHRLHRNRLLVRQVERSTGRSRYALSETGERAVLARIRAWRALVRTVDAVARAGDDD